MAVLARMFTKRRECNSGETGRQAAGSAKVDRSTPPRYLFFFQGRRRSERIAGTRSKENGALEFWFLLAVAVELIVILTLICLRSMAAAH
jgi:hypothetical protein